MAPSHYLNQCWLPISEVLWHSSQSNSVSAQVTILYNEFEKFIFFKSLPCLPEANELSDLGWYTTMGQLQQNFFTERSLCKNFKCAAICLMTAILQMLFSKALPSWTQCWHQHMWCHMHQFSAANFALAGFPLTNTLGENLPSRH